MKNSHFKAILGAAGASVIMVSSSAFANFDWTFYESYDNGNNSAYGSICSPCTENSTDSGETISVTASGWSSNGGSSTLSSSNLRTWSGLGVDTGEPSPEHATDANGKEESILFSFSTSVELTQVTMGWISGDADFSLLRFKGGDSTITGKSYSDLTSATGSWELIDNYMYSGGDYNDSHAKTANVNPADGSGNRKSSSLWLVAALNNTFWGGSSNFLGNDFFKLKSLVANTPPVGVPEPSTLALISISIVAFGFTQRRRRKTVSA